MTLPFDHTHDIDLEFSSSYLRNGRAIWHGTRGIWPWYWPLGVHGDVGDVLDSRLFLDVGVSSTYKVYICMYYNILLFEFVLFHFNLFNNIQVGFSIL